MNCKESKIICPIGATGGECTFDILCCGDLEDQYSSHTISAGVQKIVCVQDSDLEPVFVRSVSGSRTNSLVVCSSFCGELNPAPSPSPSPAPSPSPSPTPTPTSGCQCYQLLYEDAGTATVNYTACGGGATSIVINAGTFYYICSTTTPTTSDPAVTISAFGSPGGCSQNIDCDPFTPTPVAPSPTPTPAPTPSPTPTPTPTGVLCFEWTLVCPSGAAGCSYEYVDCNAVTQTGTLAPDQDVDVCVLFPRTPQINNGTAIETGEPCGGPPTPTPTPGPTPTPVPAPGCTEWTLTCPSGAASCTYYYRDCDNVLQSGTMSPDFDFDACVKVNTIVTVENGSAFNTNESCDPVPSPVPSPTYEYKEYSKCNDSSTVQVFYGPSGYNFPSVVVYNESCYENPQTTGTSTGANILGLPTYSNCTDCLDVNPNPNECLNPVNTVTITPTPSGNEYLFNGVAGNPYGTTTGTYVLSNVNSSHPIAILNYGKTSLITYTGLISNSTTGTAPDGRTYTYYWGDVTITVLGDYQTVSYACLNHGYMGGENNLGFNSTVCALPPSPSPSPTPTPTPSSVVPPIPSPVETEYTLTYSQTSKGWPSFYSYNPNFMLGMNQYFYSFSGGNLFQHNANGVRNNFYGQQYTSQITTVFNQNPLENKIFKTINLESDQAWQANLETDLQVNGFIDNTWFEEKEGSYFAFLRQTGEVPALPDQYAMRSANGIGRSTNYNIQGSITTIVFSTNPIVEIGSIVSVGDYLYFSLPSYTTINLGGRITSININIPAGINEISIDTSITGSVPMTIADPYILYIKGSVAESHGLLGHYCIFTLINDSSKATELFAVESEVMKSYP